MTTILRVTDTTTRDELAEALAHLNADAKAMSRRGFIGMRTTEYERQHERIDALLDELLAAP